MIFQHQYRLLEDQKKADDDFSYVFICNNDNYNNTELTRILT